MPMPDGSETPEERAAREKASQPNDYGQQQPAGGASGASGFINFAQRFGANKEVSEREAARYANQTSAAAGQASDSLKAAQATFAKGVNTGSVAAPGAPAGNTGAAAQSPAPYQATPLPPAPIPASNSSALTGESTRPADGPAGPSIADMLAKAGQSYTGPTKLDTTQATKDAEAADQQLNAIGSDVGVQALVNSQGDSGTAGADRLSGALIGQAGRQDFDALRSRFHPSDDITAAEKSAQEQAAAAETSSKANARDWGDAAVRAQAAKDKTDAQSAENDATAKSGRDATAAEAAKQVPTKGYTQSYGQDTPQNRQDYMMSGVDRSDPQAVANRQAQIAQYTAAMQMTTQNSMDATFNDINSVFSPVNWFTDEAGVQDPTQHAAQQNYGKLSLDGTNADGSAKNASASGSTSAMHIPWDRVGMDGFFVFTHMTPEDWQTLNGKPQNGPNGQVAWINTRAAQLRDAQTQHDSDKQSSAVGTSRST